MRPLPLAAIALLPVVLIAGAQAARAESCPRDAGPTERKIVACKPGVSAAACRELGRSMGCAVVRELPSINAVVVDIPVQRVSMAEEDLGTSVQVDLVESDRNVNWLNAVTASTSFEFSSAARDILKKMLGLKPAVPEDPEQPWGIRRVNAAAAWTSPKSQGQGISVAVIDTGISRGHPDLAGVVAGGFNAHDPDSPEAWDDDQGHGSHVAGTIAAKRDGAGVVGVAPLVKLYAVKVLDKNGNGNYSDVIAGIEWVVKKKIPIANMSLGASEGSEALRRAVASASKAGLTIIAAAGNSGKAVGYPASYPETIAVGASDINDEVAAFSSRGPAVDFIAPGMKIKSVKLGGGWVEHSGTSMAAPHVAGLAALAVARGARTPQAVRAALNIAALLIAPMPVDCQGAGMLDAAKIR